MDNTSPPLKNQKVKKYLLVYIVLFFSIASFISGFFIGGWQVGRLNPLQIAQQTIQAENVPEDLDFSLYWEVWNAVQSQFVKQPIDSHKLLHGSINGLVKSLDDPYSAFFDPEETKTFNEEISGMFEGIGAEIGIKDDHLVIVAPLPDSPAEKAGLLPGDAIVAIDGQITTDLSLDEAVTKIRGPKGTSVNLAIARGEEPAHDIQIERDTILVNTINWEIKTTGGGKDIAYLEISHYNSDTTGEFLKATQEILVAQPDGIIVDLRNNPGGFLDVAIDITSEFLDDEVVLIEQLQNGDQQKYNAQGQGQLKNTPTVILVNEGSASASEIMAGALQDHKKATIMGSQTFGKGSVQDYRQFDDGSSLKLTIAKWLTPNGNSIDELGITPDIVVEMTLEDYENDRDPQLDAALNFFDEPGGVTAAK